MKKISLDLGRKSITIRIPESAEIFGMQQVLPLPHPDKEIYAALDNPIGTPPLSLIIRDKIRSNPKARAVVVISDDTRPVPYTGLQGILFPVIDRMMTAGLNPADIRILVATGTHSPMKQEDLKKTIDPKVLELGIPIFCHDCRDKAAMVSAGRTDLAGEIFINRIYMESDIKILTGLVESHFMAGASGGRKSICPGLMDEDSTAVIHGGVILQSPAAADLVLEGNPVHRETLRVAKMAGCDFMINVTLDSKYRLSGVFAGDMEKAHLKAVEKIKSYVGFTAGKEYDLVIGHAGFVGTNHYQAAKAAVICASLLKTGGLCVLAADHSSAEPVGGINYRRMLRILTEVGAEKYEQMITGPDWTFVPEQWEPQMWGRLFKKTPPENLYYCSPDIPSEAFAWIPGRDARNFSPESNELASLVNAAVDRAVKELRDRLGREPDAAVLKDGPYAVPLQKN